MYTGVSATLLAVALIADMAYGDMVKMCLFYKAAGHARTDPILVSNEDASKHSNRTVNLLTTWLIYFATM